MTVLVAVAVTVTVTRGNGLCAAELDAVVEPHPATASTAALTRIVLSIVLIPVLFSFPLCAPVLVKARPEARRCGATVPAPRASRLGRHPSPESLPAVCADD